MRRKSTADLRPADCANKRRVAVVVETTGLGPDHRVIEIGCAEMVGRELTGRVFYHYINPEREIDLSAMAVHGISDEFVADKPTFSQVAEEFVDFVRGAELLVHNSEFDASYLDYELGLLGLPGLESICAGIVDTLKLAKEARPDRKNSLAVLSEDFRLDSNGNSSFGALGDAELTANIYLVLTRTQYESTLRS